MALLTSTARQLLGLLIMVVAVVIFAVVCLLLLPWRPLRIRACNVFGHIVGRAILAVCGTTLVGDRRPALGATMPAIYISNHTSQSTSSSASGSAPSACAVSRRRKWSGTPSSASST